MTMLELRDVRLAYGAREVLRGVNLRVKEAERVALLGPNGAGKSTLLRCITGVAEGRSGAVILDGAPIEEFGRETLARRIGVVPQQALLPFAVRVEELVALGRIPHEDPLLGLRDADREAVARAIERVGIAHLVGRDARELSLGERQLVLIAMAVAQSPRFLILDEPTVHLDLRHQVETMALLRDLNERDGVTILAVMHDLALAAHAFPRVVLLHDGVVEAEGPPAEVLTPERIRSVYNVSGTYLPAIAQARS